MSEDRGRGEPHAREIIEANRRSSQSVASAGAGRGCAAERRLERGADERLGDDLVELDGRASAGPVEVDGYDLLPMLLSDREYLEHGELRALGDEQIVIGSGTVLSSTSAAPRDSRSSRIDSIVGVRPESRVLDDDVRVVRVEAVTPRSHFVKIDAFPFPVSSMRENSLHLND